MGEAELNQSSRELILHATIFFYGDAATNALAKQIASDISMHWSEPRGTVQIRDRSYTIRFEIEGICEPGLDPEELWYNDNPRFNFFRIEEFAAGDISFVDGLGSNTGYFKLANLLQTSTTAAHEFGHTLGLDHPAVLDIRGKGIPGIMYPRGTLCDPQFQYDPNAKAGQVGGTLDPKYRKVLASDLDALRLHRLSFNENGLATVGTFSSIYHKKHIA